MRCSKTILSLFDYSGNWSRPYRENGYNVIQIDIKLGIDILQWNYKEIKSVYGILAAPPCTDFSNAGNQYWGQKDKDGRTARSISFVKRTLEIVKYFYPAFWALENPVGRVQKLIPELGQPMFKFNPCDFGDPYTKKTLLYGDFVPPLPLFIGEDRSVESIIVTKDKICNKRLSRNSIDKFYERRKQEHSIDVYYTKHLGLKDRCYSGRKEWRSITPLGFAYAFYEVNK